jgi:DNA-binding CsgD family transcriptional regulator
MSALATKPPNRLRVAVAASDVMMRKRLVSFVACGGYELVELSASPDAVLTDGAIVGPVSVPSVAIGPVDGEFAGLLSPDATPTQIDAALRAVAVGLTVRAPNPRSRNFDTLPEEAPVLLTPREIEVLGALAKGLSNKEAARHLGISPHTVKFHIESLFRKLDAATRAEAVAKGLKQQIVEF